MDAFENFSARAEAAEAAIEAAYERDALAEIEARDAAFVAWVESRDAPETLAEAAPPPARPWSDADVLKPTQAAERLPWRKSDAVAWLRSSGLILSIEGREFVIWGDVLGFIRDPTSGGGRFAT